MSGRGRAGRSTPKLACKKRQGRVEKERKREKKRERETSRARTRTRKMEREKGSTLLERQEGNELEGEIESER